MELKKCPFCGSEAKLEKIPLANNKTKIKVSCTHCRCHTGVIEVITSEEQAISECIENWNRRTV